MLSMSPGPLENVVSRELQGFDIGAIISRAASDLATCSPNEIHAVIQKSIADVAQVAHAEDAGWFHLTDCGALIDVLRLSPNPPVPALAFANGLQRLPWCMGQLLSGQAVLIYDTDDLFPAAEIDQRTLKTADVRSLAFLPSYSILLGRTILILSSSSPDTDWSNELVEQCTLLGNIFSNALQRTIPTQPFDPRDSFQQIFSESEHPMALLDFDGHFLTSNLALQTTLGYTEQELQTNSFDKFVILPRHADKVSVIKNVMTHLITKRQSEVTLVCKDKSLFPANIRVNMIKRKPTDDSVLFVSIQDLTGQKVIENELSRRQTEVADLASLLIQSQENERKRLSRELHDDIGQRLSLAASSLALLATQQAEAFSPAAGRLADLRNELDSLCTDVHEMSHDLHSYKLRHLGLKAALKDLCRRFTQPDLLVQFRGDEFEDPADKDISLCLYRVAQEALNNALKHAHTQTVTVTITRLQSRFYMTIQDSGIGFDGASPSHGLGFISMRERIKLVNGELKVTSVPGRGTEIWVAIPDRPVAPVSFSGFDEECAGPISTQRV